MRRKSGWLVLLVVVAFGLGQASAQPAFPDGTFVRDSNENVWLVSGGQLAAVPIRKVDDDEILALPVSDRWVVAGANGLVTLGDKPDWAKEPERVRQTDDPPKVTIQLNANELDRGATLEITVIATDDISLDWVEWEGEIERNNQAIDDPVLTTVHRFECFGQKVCSNTMAVNLVGQGKFVITGRARDMTGQRSDADAELTVR
jgi:hypothetical protein